MATTLEQICTATNDVNGALVFQIKSTMTALTVGELPALDIFVMKMIAGNEPKSDVFQRVATIVDLTTLQKGREAALAKNELYYLSPFFTVGYSDVATASKAKLLIQARVDRLIGDWVTYTSQFLQADPVALPLTAPDVLTQITDAYKAAKDDKAAKDTALLLAGTTKAAADTAVTTANVALTAAKAAKAQCDEVKSKVDSIKSAEHTFYEAAVAFRGTVTTRNLVLADSALTTALNSFNGTLPVILSDGEIPLGTLQSYLEGECTTRASDVTHAEEAVTAANAAAATAATNYKIAEAAAAAALTAMDTALAAALEACPTFDPASV